ncbi:ribonuclease HI [Herpetosiphon llansteffanensis]
MAKRKFYAVVKGRQPGIYTEWFGNDGAEAQVKGIDQAVFKGFASFADAEAWYRERAGRAPQHIPQNVDLTPVSLAIDPQKALAEGKVVLFSDGGSNGNPGPGGYGVVLRSGAMVRELTGGFARTTNNRMELMGVITGLQDLKQPSKVVVFSDSSYVINGMQKGWAERWSKNGWRTTTGAVKNPDLWQTLLELAQGHTIEWVQVPGHAGIKDNERCDRLAVQASRQPNLPIDHGYQD